MLMCTVTLVLCTVLYYAVLFTDAQHSLADPLLVRQQQQDRKSADRQLWLMRQAGAGPAEGVVDSPGQGQGCHEGG